MHNMGLVARCSPCHLICQVVKMTLVHVTLLDSMKWQALGLDTRSTEARWALEDVFTAAAGAGIGSQVPSHVSVLYSYKCNEFQYGST
jgi:hypothetical protein